MNINKNTLQIMNNIPLSRVLDEIMSGESHIDGIANKWKIDTGEFIQVRDDKWYSFHTHKGGTGALSLVKYWLETQNVSANKIPSEVINTLRPICDEIEKLELKTELEKTLPDVHVQSPKIKV